MKKIKRMIGQIENALAAVSFAEEAEFETAREMLKEERRVLLALREHRIDEKTLKYALNTCKRVKANLDILYVSAGSVVTPRVEQFLSVLEKEGIVYRLIQKSGCLKQAIIDYTTSNREILFAVIESSESLDVDCAGTEGRLSESWKNLRCPLVVVSEATRA
jgi:arginyl-tRNA synthetase